MATPKTNRLVAASVIGGGTLLLLAGHLTGVTKISRQPAAVSAGPTSIKYEARANIEAQARDGDSLRYRNDYTSVYRDEDGVERSAYCGEVNAKNGFGGYTGYTRFIAGSGQAAVFLESDMDERGEEVGAVFRTAWAKACLGRRI